MRYLAEFKIDNAAEYNVGQEIKAEEIFSEGDLVDVQGTSIGKGFQGALPPLCRPARAPNPILPIYPTSLAGGGQRGAHVAVGRARACGIRRGTRAWCDPLPCARGVDDVLRPACK
mmetsp:Transcript_32918/g.104794  ORF Transcript_32918/g.104794 Transcript_32918/m.104794 type:complete len:116 (+) Transcript_32918:709-1056(+)